MPIPFIAPDDEHTPFPNVGDALVEPNGLLMAGGSLSVSRLVEAYCHGVFPWYEEGEPILWWSPDPRGVLRPENLRVSKSLAKIIRSDRYEVTENLAYREVMKQCGSPRPGSSGTWVTDAMISAYCELNQLGIAKSLEVWQGHRLVGGLYGIELGDLFVGESMFSRERDASKTALVHLAQNCGYRLIDCQLESDHLRSLGAESISRDEYLTLLRDLGKTRLELLGNELSDADNKVADLAMHTASR